MKTRNENPSCHNYCGQRIVMFMRGKFLLLMCLCHVAVHAADAPHRTPLPLRPDDAIATAAGYVCHAICATACIKQ